MPIVIEALKDVSQATPYELLLKARFALAGTVRILVIDTVDDYLSIYGTSFPFEGLIHEPFYQVFIAVSAINNSEVMELIIPESLVIDGRLSFLLEELTQC